VRSVRRLYAKFQQHGAEMIAPAYGACGQNQPHQTRRELLDEARQLREQHPTWGAPLIRVMMKQKRRRRRLPAVRTLQRWFQKEALPKAPPGHRPPTSEDRATQPHQVWQMDAAEEIALRTGRRVSWLRVVDEWSGAVLETIVFGCAKFSTVGPRQVQTHLQALFSRWGRPERFRVDNGFPWGSTGDFPTDLALWLIGLEIPVSWNAPRQPQKNGTVERSQGVGKSWAEPGACGSVAELQRRLREMDRIQREEYPYRDGLSRMEVFPSLKRSRRAYGTTWEQRHWSLDLVLEHLSQYLASRRVDQAGLISIYNRNYYVGKHQQAKIVSVMLDPLTCQWVILDDQGQQLRSHPAEQISRERIVNLNVTHRRTKPK
jgi:transposase InsO family protein